MKRRRVRKNNSFSLTQLFDKKHRPVHGMALGSLMLLLQSVWGMLALLGGSLFVVSLLAYFINKNNK